MVLVAHKYTANEALFLVWRLIVKVMTRLVMNQAQNLQIGMIQKESHDFLAQKLMKYTKMTSIVVHRIFCNIENQDSYYQVSLKLSNLLPTLSFLFHMVFTYLKICYFLCNDMLLKGISYAANKFSHFFWKKTMPSKPGKVKIVLCGKMFYFC